MQKGTSIAGIAETDEFEGVGEFGLTFYHELERGGVEIAFQYKIPEDIVGDILEDIQNSVAGAIDLVEQDIKRKESEAEIIKMCNTSFRTYWRENFA